MDRKRTPAEVATRANALPSTVESPKGLALDWSFLVPLSVHPIKVAILEAMAWLARPVSPVELHKMFEYPDDLSTLSYHVGKLVEMGAIEKISDRPVRGARETFYFLTAAAMTVGGDVKSPASPK